MNYDPTVISRTGKIQALMTFLLLHSDDAEIRKDMLDKIHGTLTFHERQFISMLAISGPVMSENTDKPKSTKIMEWFFALGLVSIGYCKRGGERRRVYSVTEEGYDLVHRVSGVENGDEKESKAH